MPALFEELYNKIYVTFIYESRWRFFTDGLWMTLLLTFASFILGTLAGVLICALKLSRISAVRKGTEWISSLFMQLPTMVLLMFFVYILFAESSMSVVVIVILGLTIKAGTYMSDIFYTAVKSVNSGEAEAARTLGMTKVQSFIHVVFPQAVASALPVYKNQFVITLQETSIVGYLAIQDLTRASDIITSRTLDAFFGLIVISLLYLFIGWLTGLLLDLLGKKKHLGGEAK
ncbi:MAG: ABC transporter permease subunit [Eubacteriales bacterium]|nr:ABC transporter permease subunit [Eubacteriales bacterium]